MASKSVNIDILARDKTRQALNKVQNNLNQVKKSAFNLKNALVAVGTGLAIKSILDTTAEFEDLKDSLDSVTGSAKAGAQAFDFISDFATRSQFSVQELARSFISLKASGIEPTEKLFRTFTDTASVTTDQLGSLEALTRIFSRGVQGGLGLEELNMIADRGVPVFKILEKEIGKTRLELSEFGKTTEGASIILNALQKGLSETFTGATEKKLDNLSVAFSNLGIALDNAQNAFGEEVSPELVKFTEHISNLIKFFEPLLKGLGKVTNFLIGSVNRAFEMIGHGVNFVIDAFEDFAFTVGIIDEKTKRVEKTITGVRIAIEAIGKKPETLNSFKKLNNQIKPLVTTLNETEKAFIDVSKSATDNMADSLTELVKGTVSAKDAFRDMANSIISDLTRMAIKKYITDQLFGFATRAISASFGAPVVASNVEGGAVVGTRANGGSVMGGKPYLVGERGAELFVPNRSGTIVPNDQLGRGSTPVVINQTINLSTGVAQTIRAEVMNMLPQITEATKGAVLDAKRRGGTFSSAFGV